MEIRKNQGGKVFFRVTEAGDNEGVVVEDAVNLVDKCHISLDAGADAVTTNDPVLVDAVNHPGVYSLTLTIAESSAGVIVITIDTSAMTGTDPRPIPAPLIIYPTVDYEGDIMGSGFATITDSLQAIRAAMENSIAPIVRSS